MTEILLVTQPSITEFHYLTLVSVSPLKPQASLISLTCI